MSKEVLEKLEKILIKEVESGNQECVEPLREIREELHKLSKEKDKG